MIDTNDLEATNCLLEDKVTHRKQLKVTTTSVTGSEHSPLGEMLQLQTTTVSRMLFDNLANADLIKVLPSTERTVHTPRIVCSLILNRDTAPSSTSFFRQIVIVFRLRN